MLDQGLQGLEVLTFEALLNLGNKCGIEGRLEDIDIDWLINCMQDVDAGLQGLLSQSFGKLKCEVLQHNGKNGLTVGSETLFEVLRNLVDDLESGQLCLEGASVHG